MIYENDLAVIITTDDKKDLARIFHQIALQSHDGIQVEYIVYNGTGSDISFNSNINLSKIKFLKSKYANDFGCISRDMGNIEANSEYVCYWDDDNIYFPHAIVSLYLTAQHHDIGIVNTHHNGYIIPNDKTIRPGYIDTMCVCIKKELAIKEKWADGGGRYTDYRYISKLLYHKPMINFSSVIIGHHL